MEKIHVIAFDIPWPASYGGVIDVFYRIRSLSESGISVILHCFEYGNRKQADELKKWCEQVHYYPRRKWPFTNGLLPYIVSSRSNKQLLENLLKDNHPILFEALHTCFYLSHPKLANRIKLVRMHNIEHDYYRLLAEQEKSVFSRLYFYAEAWLLKRFEHNLNHATLILAISEKDKSDLEKYFPGKVWLLQVYHGNDSVCSLPGKGEYCLYHGKLSVAENHHAAMFLVTQVFNKISVKLILAGDGIRKELALEIEKYGNIDYLPDLTPIRIDELVKNAHINVLPTFQPTGIKLKLINVLFNGRFLVANKAMVEGSGLESIATLAESADEIADAVVQLMNQNFTEDEIERRRKILGNRFETRANTILLVNKVNSLL